MHLPPRGQRVFQSRKMPIIKSNKNKKTLTQKLLTRDKPVIIYGIHRLKTQEKIKLDLEQTLTRAVHHLMLAFHPLTGRKKKAFRRCQLSMHSAYVVCQSQFN